MIPLLCVVFVLAVLFGAPAALGAGAGLVIGFKAGQYHRGWTHTRSIWRAHKEAIRGGR